MKYCNDCRFAQRGEYPDDMSQWRYARCTNVTAQQSDGEEMVHPMFNSPMMFCSTMRMKGGVCGPDAKLFQAKP